ncbi:hypothetical protein SNE40_016065 [Patella caerulea]|uniref:C2 domain-containing protein n=1 Tax=Patella caerulea TaxID=87958 RepID=A0AAN8PMD0_PATCE
MLDDGSLSSKQNSPPIKNNSKDNVNKLNGSAYCGQGAQDVIPYKSIVDTNGINQMALGQATCKKNKKQNRAESKKTKGCPSPKISSSKTCANYTEQHVNYNPTKTNSFDVLRCQNESDFHGSSSIDSLKTSKPSSASENAKALTRHSSLSPKQNHVHLQHTTSGSPKIGHQQSCDWCFHSDDHISPPHQHPSSPPLQRSAKPPGVVKPVIYGEYHQGTIDSTIKKNFRKLFPEGSDGDCPSSPPSFAEAVSAAARSRNFIRHINGLSAPVANSSAVKASLIQLTKPAPLPSGIYPVLPHMHMMDASPDKTMASKPFFVQRFKRMRVVRRNSNCSLCRVSEVNQLEDPRLQWRQQQEVMLKEYLVTAQDDLEAKKEIYNVKEQRLAIAQDEYSHLHNTLSGWKSSRTSLNSNSSVGSTKYDPDLLKADVNLAKERVARLKWELQQISAEMQQQERGVEKLARVDQKLSGMNGGYSVTQAQGILGKIRQIQQAMSNSEKEKMELMQTLARLKEEFLLSRYGGSSPDVSTLSLNQDSSTTASQTDLRGEFGLSHSRYIVEKARLRLQCDEAYQKLSDLKIKLATVEDRMVPGQTESDKDRLLLLQEKDQLVRELRSIDPKGRSDDEMSSIRLRIRQLEQDLQTGMELSNKQIAERLKLQNEKTSIQQQLSETTKLTSQLEMQLKSMSFSTLSISSGSSLGSIGSLSASSRGSLNSLSAMDIYNQAQTGSDVNIQDLHQRVEKLLQGHSTCMSPINETHVPVAEPEVLEDFPRPMAEITAAATEQYLQSVMASSENVSTAVKPPSPKTSLSSAQSPPTSPYEVGPPPSYEQHVERQRRIQIGNSWTVAPPQTLDQSKIVELIPNVRPVSNQNVPSTLGAEVAVTNNNMNNNNFMRRHGGELFDSTSNPPLSPISESSSGVCNNLSGGNTRSVSAAVSDESVAGDSGVFEAAVKRTGDIDEVLETKLESAQIQIKLKYEGVDKILCIGVEQGRNLLALPFPKNSRVCIKTALLPHTAAFWETKALFDLKSPKFNEIHTVEIAESKLFSQTLQVNVFCILEAGRDDCLGSFQVSLADFDPKEVSIRWYNILNFKFMQPACRKVCTPSQQSSSGSSDINKSSSQNSQKDGNDRVQLLLEASSAKLRKSSLTSDDRSSSLENTSQLKSLQVKLKEESSDESTIISSQTSTLTRNQGPEAMEGHGDVNDVDGDYCEDCDDDIEEEDEGDYNEMQQLVLEDLERLENSDNFDDRFTESDESLHIRKCDQSTNTEGEYRLRENKRRTHEAVRNSAIRRSQTFSPACRQGPGYICKLNRSDSDSSMPKYKKGPFHRNALERRSLRWKKPEVETSGPPSGHLPIRTSLDLELDLQANHTKFDHLQDEIARLKDINNRLLEAKTKGETELPQWMSDDQSFQNLLSEAEKLAQRNDMKTQASKQERRAEQLLKRATRDVQRMRKNSPASNVISFREKMAYITSAKTTVPVLPGNIITAETDRERLEEFLRDDRIGEEV